MQTSPSAKPDTAPKHALDSGAAPGALARRLETVNVAVIIVTWNRADDVDGALRAVARQDIGAGRLDVFVIDNASTDGTTDRLRSAWQPDRLYDNPTATAHEPAFALAAEPAAESAAPTDAGSNGHAGAPSQRHPFASLTIIRNSANHGGCGGFNTGLCAVDQLLDVADSPRRPDYVWLVDDDIDLAPDACRRLVEAAEADPGAGVIGSRAVDLHDRETTFETTIYFDFDRGRMGDAPAPGHRLEQSHRAWLKQVGSSRGRGAYTGTLEVDVVSACSLLARWSAVREVGFWDKRYFIYCDDADWCLRMARAGWRVMLCLDAVVYHTPWFDKLTPARLYYSQRNIVWTMQKSLGGWRLRYATARWMAALMRESLQAAFRRRTFHADIIRRTALHIATGRGGRFDDNGPPKIPFKQALEQAGALAPSSRIAVICPRPEFVEWADELRLGSPSLRGGPSSIGEWIYLIRNDAIPPEHDPASDAGHNDFRPQRSEGLPSEGLPSEGLPSEGLPSPPRSGGPPEIIIYSHRLRSKLRRQLPLLTRPPNAVIVFNQTSDFPLLRGRHNLHIDQRTRHPPLAQVEPDGLATRAVFCGRWLATAARVAWFLATLRRYRSSDRFG